MNPTGDSRIESLSRWRLPPEMPFAVMRELQDFSRIQQRLLFNRDILSAFDAHAFLLPRPFHSPFELKTMRTAVETILETIDADGKIVVYGDYDVDGVTASSLLVQALRALGADASGYIPNRFEEGYGVNPAAIEQLAKSGTALTVTVDCGIRSPEEVELAKSLGMKMIVTDHHEPGPVLPDASAVINPKRPDDAYPDKDLAGVGLSYKLAAALLSARPVPGVRAEDWLDFVAIGTICDMVPLRGENRDLARAGLELLRKSSRPCIVALAQVSGVEVPKIDSQSIGFSFGPRLNAAGRLETAMLSFNLMMSADKDEAIRFAEELNVINRQRQAMTEEIQQSVLAGIDENAVPPIVFAADESYNMGVVGLGASRITEKLNRPAIVGAISGGEIRASCRSIASFSIIDALDSCAGLFVRHGGHPMAAGFTISTANWDALRERLTLYAEERLSGKDLRPVKDVEAELKTAYCNEETVAQIRALEPFGTGNREPLFLLRAVRVKSAQLIGKDKTHLRLEVADGNDRALQAIAFRQGPRIPPVGALLDLLFGLDINEFQGKRSIQLRIVDFRTAEERAAKSDVP